MKIKKNKTMRKVMLMVIASVLVAAVSVGATLAYLTAVTNEKDNVFYASGNIDPVWVEPNFDQENAYVYTPGKQVDKDPIVHNNTEDLGIYVGAKLDFYVSFDETSYIRVPYEVFEQYVTIDWNIGSYDATNYPSAKWTDVTSDVTELADTKANKNTSELIKSGTTKYQWSKYYLYDSEIGKKLINDNVVNDNSYQTPNTDATAPLFKVVTPSGKIMISPEVTTGYNKVRRSGPSVTDIYKHFDFKIIVSGWGVSSANTTKDAAQAEIKDHLGKDLAVYANSETLLASNQLET